ncbi:hypothetical protein IW492_17150 [Enterococcus sp. BWB1-3]|uniref:hypothetical protein n=1 Tax=Enterococcus sp. BWB1-3 TaxID=2787713 RepID=UPI001921E449|nr:hypothetical protein [Enterococcus sp. BWB1-3]MBL1230956.1 hypothetical protein [Enterococcus sp. BWB1-3]
MIGNNSEINLYNWNDWYFEKLELNFDDIKVYISNDTDEIIELICKKYIGISYLGHWDESVIKSMKVNENTELTEKSIKVIKENYKDMVLGGGYRNITDIWCEFVIEFIDGNTLGIVCSEIVLVSNSE